MKKIFLITAFLLAGTLSRAQNNANSVPLITVTGESVVKVKPDEVILTFGVETRNVDAQEAKRTNDKLMSDVLKFLKEKKVDPKNIQTDYLRLNSIYNYEKGKQEEFVATQTVKLKITDLSKYEEISSGLLIRGINQINQIEFGTSKLEQLKQEARQLAIKAAKEKANMLATEIGQAIGKAYYINENSSQVAPYPMYGNMMKSMDMAESNEGGPTIAPGEIEVKGNITASFVLN